MCRAGAPMRIPSIVSGIPQESSHPPRLAGRGTPFKVEQGELFPENLMENPEWVVDGSLTDAGMAMLRERMPHVDFSNFEQDRDVNKVAELITVGSIVAFIERKLSA